MEALKSESIVWDGYMSLKKRHFATKKSKSQVYRLSQVDSCITKLHSFMPLIRDAEARISSAMVESKVKEEMVGWAQFCDLFDPREEQIRASIRDVRYPVSFAFIEIQLSPCIGIKYWLRV